MYPTPAEPMDAQIVEFAKEKWMPDGVKSFGDVKKSDGNEGVRCVGAVDAVEDEQYGIIGVAVSAEAKLTGGKQIAFFKKCRETRVHHTLKHTSYDGCDGDEAIRGWIRTNIVFALEERETASRPPIGNRDAVAPGVIEEEKKSRVKTARCMSDE